MARRSRERVRREVHRSGPAHVGQLLCWALTYVRAQVDAALQTSRMRSMLAVGCTPRGCTRGSAAVPGTESEHPV